MRKALLLTAFVLAIGAIVFWKTKIHRPVPPPSGGEPAVSESASYWTCPMHPQIHSEHPGECPICHMKLVQVKASGSHPQTGSAENRSGVMPTSGQLQLVGIHKLTVERMDLIAHIPVSGRLLSASTVAFQVYESDLRYVKSGLAFTGESSFIPESELAGAVNSVDNIVDPTSRTVRVVGSLRKAPKGLIPETTFRGDLSIVLKGVIGIPESSVLHTGEGAITYLVAEDGMLSPQSVKLGLKTDGYYEVLSGLNEGQKISSGPNFLIDSEAKIRGTSGHSHH